MALGWPMRFSRGDYRYEIVEQNRGGLKTYLGFIDGVQVAEHSRRECTLSALIHFRVGPIQPCDFRRG